MTGIFDREAPAYWAKGISVIPLRYNDKRPSEDSWNQWCLNLPDTTVQNLWLKKYINNNIGLALGPASNIVVIDIDTDDEKIIAAINSVLPKSPWRRIGQKGYVEAFKYNGIGTFRIDDANGNRLVEFLSRGAQVVLPPSIHPKTLKPYNQNVSLIEVYDELPEIDENIKEKLRTALSAVTELRSSSSTSGKFSLAQKISLGARDSEMTRMAGAMASAVLRGDHTLKTALLAAHHWATDNAERVEGDEIDPEKAKRKLLEFILVDINQRGKVLPTGWDMEITPEEKIEWGLEVAEEQTEWTYTQLLDYMLQEFQKYQSPNDPGRMQVVNFILKRLAKSPTIGDLEKATVLKQLRDQSGLNLPVSHFTKQLNSIIKGPMGGENHTEIAKELIHLYQQRHGELAFYGGKFWEWHGSHWKELNESDLWEFLADNFGDLPAAKKASDHKGILQISQKLVPNELSALEIKGINFINGLLTEDLNLVPHQPEHGMTYVLPYSYKADEAGKCPRFFDFLQTSWGHHEDFKEKVMALQEAFASTLFGVACSYQRAFMCYGTGGSGKSQLLEIIGALVPEEAKTAIGPERWAEQFSRANFAGKLLNRAGEINVGKSVKIPGATFKSIISGDEISGEFKYQDLFRFTPKCAHWFAGNDLPCSTDYTNGFNRRWLFFTFDKIVKGTSEDVTDLGKLIVSEEMPGIVAWAVEGMKRLKLKKDYTDVKSSNVIRDMMAVNNSLVRQWMKMKIKVDKNSSLKAKISELFSSFQGFSAQMGKNRPSFADFEKEFSQILSEFDINSSVNDEQNGSYYVGVWMNK